MAYEVDYSDLNSCFSFIQVELEPFGLAPPRDTRAKLAQEAAKDRDGATVYRVYSRLARILGRLKNENHLNEGEGAKFRDADKVISGWLLEQSDMDQSLGLVLPGSHTARRTGSRSIPVRSSF
jgi:hypothetical protein